MSALRKMSTFLGYPPAEGEYEDADQDFSDGYAPIAEDAYTEDVEETYEAQPESPEPVAHPDLRRIVTVHPSTYNEARVIGESFRDGVPVIVNLTNMTESDARRMVDFSAGLVFGLHGAIERVTPRVFLLTPSSVEIDGGETTTPAHGRFFNQS